MGGFISQLIADPLPFVPVAPATLGVPRLSADLRSFSGFEYLSVKTVIEWWWVSTDRRWYTVEVGRYVLFVFPKADGNVEVAQCVSDPQAVQFATQANWGFLESPARVNGRDLATGVEGVKSWLIMAELHEDPKRMGNGRLYGFGETELVHRSLYRGRTVDPERIVQAKTG